MCKHYITSKKSVSNQIQIINNLFRSETISLDQYKKLKNKVLNQVVISQRDCVANKFIF